MTDTSTHRPFDERAALQELEALAERIQATRRQRQAAVAEFESFVKGFREDRYQELIAAQGAQPSAPPAVARKTEPRPGPAPEPRKAVAPAPAIAAKAAPTPPPAIVPAALPRAKVDVASLLNAPRARLALAGLGVAALVVIGAWFWGKSADSGPATLPPATRAEPPAAAAPQAVASTGPVDSARSTAPRALNIELVTLRPVWTRVVVDGQKTIERELPKDSRIPVSGDRAIAIRAGDAGAIRVTVNGKDQGVLGRDGQIAARTWTAPPAPAR